MYKPDSSYKFMSRKYKAEEKLVSKIFGLDTGKPMNLSCFTGDVSEVVSLMRTCLSMKNEAVIARDSQKQQKVNSCAFHWKYLITFIKAKEKNKAQENATEMLEAEKQVLKKK